MAGAARVLLIFLLLSVYIEESDGLLTNVSHILTSSKEQALEIKEIIMDTAVSFDERSALFSKQAYERSRCPSGRGSHGNLGVFSPGQMEFGSPPVKIEKFEYLAFHGKIGAVLGPFEAKGEKRDFGWQIIFVHSRNYDQKLAQIDGEKQIVAIPMEPVAGSAEYHAQQSLGLSEL
jgi:hypothetical protein